MNGGGLHHINQRKRVHQNLEKYPHPNRTIRFFDKFLMLIAVIGPLMALPQIFKIFFHKQALGVSTLSFGFYALFDIPWIIYGIIHREKPIIITYIIWFAVNTIIVVGSVIY